MGFLPEQKINLFKFDFTFYSFYWKENLLIFVVVVSGFYGFGVYIFLVRVNYVLPSGKKKKNNMYFQHNLSEHL